jgi:hypothetical protein
MAVDTTGITRQDEIQTATKGQYMANLVTVRTHVLLADGRTVQLMPTNDARAELPPDAVVIWHERMGQTPQEVALAGSQPVDGSEITAKTALAGSDESLAARLAGAETELRRLKELVGNRMHGDTLASIESQIADLKKKVADPATGQPAPDLTDPAQNPNVPAPDPEKVRTAVKPSPSKP